MTNDLKAIFANYGALIVDLWGVIHDGSALYPGVAQVLAHLHEQKKPVVFLSNAPRVSEKAQATLDKLGIPREHYKAIVTSGQVAHDLLTREEPANYYYLGPSKDEDIIADVAHFAKTPDMAAADFVLCTGYEQDFQPHADIIPLLDKLLAAELPMLCVNPDYEVVKHDGTQQLCAGAVAEEYELLGGEVDYIGKPYPHVYDVCTALLGAVKTLAIGDNPDTDIAGAKAYGLDCLLITGGILKARGEDPSECGATYVLPAFAFGQ
jgi:HAD superfamily hydrolase (TIGR01459 family)